MMERYSELYTRASRACIPLAAHFELTYACNARCVHCFQAASSRRHLLGESDWTSVVDQAREVGSLIFTLSGGEPLVSPCFWPVAEHVRRRGLALRILTNGSLLTRDTVPRIARLRPFSVEVSVFSLDPKQHDAVTGVSGSLGRAVRGLLHLKRAGVPTAIKCPLLAPSAESFRRVHELAKRLGASVVFDAQIAPRSDGDSSPTRCRGDDQAIESYLGHAETRTYTGPPSGPLNPDQPPCGLGRTGFVISPEGDVLPCPLLRMSAGNVRTGRLADIWANSPLLQKLRARRFGDLVPCGSCPRSGYCGRCSAIALLEDGNIDGPSSRACHIAELREKVWGLSVPEGVPYIISPS